jgi:hypothetical protein
VVQLPVWRVSVGAPETALLYLDPVTGAPTGYVDRAARRARWLRDAPHSFDYGFLNNRRPWWDLVMLPLLCSGLVSAGTGLWMAIRRWRPRARRMAPRA